MLRSKDVRRDLKDLQEVFLLKSDDSWKFRTYDEMIQDGTRTTKDDLFSRMSSVEANDVCNLQFTSGTTGSPKAAMLTHKYAITTLVVGF